MNTTTLETVLSGLMRRYTERVPDVAQILTAMQQNKLIGSADDIENDHIAFRTLGVPHLGIASFEKIFKALGYTRRDHYHFAGKKLDAYWYSPPSEKLPRIFVSELRVADLNESARAIITSYTDAIQSDPVDALNLTNPLEIDAFLHTPLWRLPNLADYLELAKESEYAAWVIHNRYYLNHYTISVHNLPAPFNTLEKFNEFLESRGVVLNTSGGKIKKSPDGLLLQSSTVAEMLEAEFADQQHHTISGSYVEFAERLVLPQFQHLEPSQLTREHRREGFEAGNADKIFESTYSQQTAQRT